MNKSTHRAVTQSFFSLSSLQLVSFAPALCLFLATPLATTFGGMLYSCIMCA